MNNFHWRNGNRLVLLENGEEFFPSVFAAIRSAQKEVLIETFLIFDDETGRDLQTCLIDAARRGVRVELTADGYGAAYLPDKFIREMTQAGVCYRIYDPSPRVFGMRTNVFRRLHRKLVIVDNRVAFVGGLNFADYHYLHNPGEEAREDFAIEMHGPIVADIRQFAKTAFSTGDGSRRESEPRPHHTDIPEPTGSSDALFAVRDNQRHRDDIEEQYRIAIRDARRDILIANAYFFPGYRFFRDLRRASERGVRVRLLLQGAPDIPWAQTATHLLYNALMDAKIEIYEYYPNPFHGKVAVIDDEWATVGSSNLDPLSLSLNLEANVFVRDGEFNNQLRTKLERILTEDCEEIDPRAPGAHVMWRWVPNFLIYHFLRHFPAWVGWLPAHTPNFVQWEPGPDGGVREQTHELEQHHG